MPFATEENLTDLALKQWEACHSPRLRQIMQSLVKHLHGFARDVDLKQDEWLMAVDWLAKTGKLCTDKRHEFILLSDVLGKAGRRAFPVDVDPVETSPVPRLNQANFLTRPLSPRTTVLMARQIDRTHGSGALKSERTSCTQIHKSPGIL